MTNDQKSIEKKVDAILMEYKLDEFPIDIEKLAKELEIKIIREDFEDNIAGLLYCKKGKKYIGLNSNHHLNRQRFTVAHEIGHYVLHHPKDDDIILDTKASIFYRTKDISREQKKEIEANRFAATILMPEELLKNYMKDEHININDDIALWKFSNNIKVSEQTLTYRLLNLGIISYR